MPPETLQQIRDDLGPCKRCNLCRTRTNIVFGSGSPTTPWMVVGEAPGSKEDLQGKPFVGRAGELLTELITESGWNRESVFVTNVVKCRPPGNRDPHQVEIAACRPFLFRQIRSIQPVVITTLGKPAANLLLGCKEPMYKLRGKVTDFMGVKVIPTYHPSYIQRGSWDKLDLMKEDFAQALLLLFAEGIVPPNWKESGGEDISRSTRRAGSSAK